MDTAENADSEPHDEAIESNSDYLYSGFWRRVIAYFTDSILIGTLGLLIGFSFIDYFLSIGQTGRFFGLAVYLGYFGILNSKIGNGQTLGKRWLDIKVVDGRGVPLDPLKSLGRQTIIALPIFSNGLNLGPASNSLIVGWLLSISIFVIGGLTFYLLVFNRATRRCLHDYVCDSHVVKVAPDKNTIKESALWKGHFAIFGSIVVIAIAVASWFGVWVTKNFDLTQVTALYEKLSEQDNISVAGVNLNRQTRHSNGQTMERTILAITAYSPHPLKSKERYVMDVVKILLEEEEPLPESDVITVHIGWGFDLGIAKYNTISTVSGTPSGWKTAHQDYSSSGTPPEIQFSTKTSIRF